MSLTLLTISCLLARCHRFARQISLGSESMTLFSEEVLPTLKALKVGSAQHRLPRSKPADLPPPPR